MAWKDVPVGASTNNRMWINDGPPGVQTSVSVTRGFHVNIPTIDGGIGTILNYDNTVATRLNDNILTTDVYYSGNYYTLTTAGDAVGLEFSSINRISSIELYVNGFTGATVPANTLHVLTSTDGITWTRVESFATGVISYVNETNYGVFTINLTAPIDTKYIAVRATTTFYIYNYGNINVRLREFKALTPIDIGIDDDTYIHRSTGNMYTKKDGVWDITYTAPEIPRHLVGESVTPPSGAGIPIGSFYIVKQTG